MVKYGGWLLIFFYGETLVAQEPLHSRYVRFDVESGLPQNLVSGIVQDDDGYIWVSTMDGLARFDGKEFHVLRHKPEDSLSLSFNAISGLHKDQYNNLWVRFDVNQSQSVNKINPRTFTVSNPKTTQVPQEIFFYKNQKVVGEQTGFLGKPDHWLWFRYDRSTAHMNVELLDTTNRKFISFLKRQGNSREDKILAWSEDGNGKLWLVTLRGIEVYDDRWLNFKTIPFPKPLDYDPEQLYTLPLRLFHQAGNRLVIVVNNKLIIYNSQSGQFKQVYPNGSKPNIIQNETLDVEGRLVFVTDDRIYRLDGNDQLTWLWQYLGGEGIRCIMVDKTNTLWVGTDPDGLYKVNLLVGSFKSHAYQDDFITDVLMNEIKHQTIPREAILPSSAYYSRYTYCDQGLLLFLAGGEWTNRLLLIAKNKSKLLYQSKYVGLVAFHDKQIWLLDDRGFMHHWANLTQPPAIFKTELPLDNGYCLIGELLMDSHGYFALTPQDGIYEFKDTRLIKTIRPQGNYSAHVMCHDPKRNNILWIGTISGGLFEWDKTSGKLLSTYTTENGLPNNTINNIVLDSLGFMWMSTNNGITRFNPATKTFSNYSVADGLMESEFNRHHEFLLPDGQIAMGGTKGYAVFNPNHFLEDTTEPEIKISRILVNGKIMDHTKDSTILSKPVNQLNEINLFHTNNSIGLEIAAMQYNAPEKNRYRYKLDGYDKEWVDNGTDHRVRINLLPPGHYTLLLNASNTAGVWSPHVRKLDIIIHPPFWLTWWAYSIYGFIMVLIVRIYWSGYKKRLKAKQEGEFNVREAARLRELDETKTRFFSNITHEFRTPLTLILSPLEKHLGDSSLSPQATQTLLNNNFRHASQLLKLVNQLLDISKLEAGQMQVNPSTGELAVFMEQCVNSFQTQANEKNIDLTFSCETIKGYYLFDQEKWEKIVFNLLSNAIKFTPKSGNVHVSVSEVEGRIVNHSSIRIQVRDSGIGISEEKLLKIFQRFYQVDDSATRQHEGTGIGLALVKELVDLMKGKIDVSSEPGIGTLFTVDLLIEKLKEVPYAQEVTSINNFHLTKEDGVLGIDHDVPVILVTEDNDELRRFIKESLTANWKVLEACNGLEAWVMIERELPEIVISDVMMPSMNGFELCRKSKRDPRTAHIGFIMLTAKAAQESKIEGLESGADEYLTKPFHLYELELRVRNLLQEQDSLRKHLQEKVLPALPIAERSHINDVFLTRMEAFLEKNLDNSELNAETIAQAMAMSKSTLNRKMKALLNISIIDYLKQYRLQKALALLSSGLTVSETSFQVGFETASYFTQCFKEKFGKTPTEFTKVSV